MTKGKNKSKKRAQVNQSLCSIEKYRIGGSIALTGFDFQCLYSCYTLLEKLNTDSASISLEGLEDIDSYELEDDGFIQHIQVKYSTTKQDASYLKSILKNYLEVYLCDPFNKNRFFTLIYDFDIANGNFKKLAELTNDKTLDISATKYWNKEINEILTQNPSWNWANFSLQAFLKQLVFQRVNYSSIQSTVERLLIEKYNISTGNELLYAHSLFYFCFSNMRARQRINKSELDTFVSETTDLINRGAVNPAIHWVKQINFDEILASNDNLYYEGKKASPSDIVAGSPISRPKLENSIIESISKNTITVIKASSGQGKSTLAWKVAYETKNDYYAYQVLWCADSKELDNIVKFVRSKIRIGQIPLLILDNLDAQLKEWNKLTSTLQNEIGTNYKILVTTREDDWFNYSGDQSALRSLNLLNLYFDKEQAYELYQVLKSKSLVHAAISSWESAWEKLDHKGLLIEYTYLLTHGEMLADRIASQIAVIEKEQDKDIKLDVLRKICFADILGIRLSSDKLCAYYQSSRVFDISNILNQFENEFLLTDIGKKFVVTGLHPVRSQHLLNYLGKFQAPSNTIIEMLDVVDNLYVSKLYSNMPDNIGEDEREEFYQNLIAKTKTKSYKYFFNALRGLFSGSIYLYFKQHKGLIDIINSRGGLFVFLMEINPYTKFEKFDAEVKTLTEMHKILPNDDNVSFLKQKAEEIEKFDIQNSDYYIYANCLFSGVLKDNQMKIITDGFADLAYWLITIDPNLNPVSTTFIQSIWDGTKYSSPDNMALSMLCWYLADENEYFSFVSENKQKIFDYILKNTTSALLYEENNENSIKVEYFLLPSAVRNANDESCKRIDFICRLLPFYETYCADAIQPKVELLENIKLPNDAHKAMPRRNVILPFNQEFAKLWSNTIISHYEADTVYDWLRFWNSTRVQVLKISKLLISIFDKRLNQKNITKEQIAEFDLLQEDILGRLRIEYPYPRQSRPFDNSVIPDEAEKAKQKFFPSIRNFINQIVGLINRDSDKARLSLINLRSANAELLEMQVMFGKIAITSGYYDQNQIHLERDEEKSINTLLSYCQFYVKNESTRSVSKYQVQSWTKKETEQLINSARTLIESAKFGVSFEYPLTPIDDGTLYTLPLISKHINLTDTNNVGALMLTLLPLSMCEFDFIHIIFKSKLENCLMRQGLRINKAFLINAKEVIEGGDESILSESFHPLPIDVPEEFLTAFEKKYNFEPQTKSSDDFSSILEQLWKYSQLEKHISNKNILSKMQKSTVDKIENLSNSISDHDSLLYNHCQELKRKVLHENFDYNEQEFNRSINFIVQETMQQASH